MVFAAAVETRIEITDADPLGDVGEGFDGFFDRLLPRAVSLAQGLLNDRAAAEDAAVEALARAYVEWGRVALLSYRDAWVLRVTANVAYDQVRKAGRELSASASPPSPRDAIETATLRVTLVPALRKLSRRQRDAVLLSYIVGLTNEEVALALGCTVGTVKVHVHRGIARLRRELGDELGPVSLKKDQSHGSL
jgi:RNA polymerase sigma factor (sigma-70 family)